MTTITNKEEFFARLEPRLSPTELIWVKAAYIFAKFGHRAQVRKETDEEGNPLRYFEHVKRSAIIMMDELHIYDPELIATALLHDCLEDTEDVTAPMIEHMFGSRVARIVRCLTNIPKDGYYDRLKTSNNDVLTVKLCDRADNVRSFEAGGKAFAKRKSKETIEHYVTLFRHRLSESGTSVGLEMGSRASFDKLIDEIEETCARLY